MAKIKTRVTLRTPQAAALIKAASNEALTDMGLQALQDASKHVPRDVGTLEDSGLTNSDKKAKNGKFVMKWEEPYSQYLWNGKICMVARTREVLPITMVTLHLHLPLRMRNGRSMPGKYTANSGSKCIRRH